MNRTAIVTGASRGIGAAVAQRLAKDGFNVIINFAGNAAEAETLVGTIRTAGGSALAVQADVSNSAAVRSMFDQAESVYGGIDVLVNNAGIMQLKAIADTTDEFFDRHVDINLKGVFYGTYAATKAGVEAMTHVLSKELRGRNVTVNAVAPGPTGTDLFLQGKSKELIEQFVKLSPLERLGTPQDIANTVSFLAGPDGSWINGQVLRANGGVI
jgi:3-oxoacyl-[acyl-carrier protein] reductase